MKTFKCFVVMPNDNVEPYPCNEIHNNDMSNYFMQFMIFIFLLFFFVLIRPVFFYCAKTCCLKKTATESVDTTPPKPTENKEIQCALDMNIHKVIINPDTSINLVEEAM